MNDNLKQEDRMKPLRVFTLGLAAVSLAAVIALAWVDLRSDRERDASQLTGPKVEKIVAEYLQQHPEVIVAALQDYQVRQKAQQTDKTRKEIVAARNELIKDPTSPVGANAAGDVSIVEFFDYQCPYCKAVAPDLAKALAADGKVRLIYKEFPILGPSSITAAKAALAAQAQGKYVPFHEKLMAYKGHMDDGMVYSIASTVGLDIDRLKADMESPDIKDTIKRNYQLADKLDIQGTPAFIIGDELLPGAASVDALIAAIKRARGS
jgi:protein-disulfide isomerase